MATTELIELAIETSRKAYVPYSHFPVGAVLVTKMEVFIQGQCIENASYPFDQLRRATAILKQFLKAKESFPGIDCLWTN